MTQVREREFDEAERNILDKILTRQCGEIVVILGEGNVQKINETHYFKKVAVLNKLPPELNNRDIACIIAEYTALPFAKKSIDALVLSHLVETCPDYPQILQEASGVLRDDGVLMITMLNRLRRLAKKQVPGVFKVIGALHAAGFDTINIEYYAMGVHPRWLNFLLKRYLPGLSQGYLIVAKRHIAPILPLAESFEFDKALAVKPLLETRSKSCRETR